MLLESVGELVSGLLESLRLVGESSIIVGTILLVS